ncbi:5-(carboxyamino)imidazole ribonucleotide synthase [Neptunomonas sp. CHC150]|uniref:5-(carboxyamino)imidazole ribonucleotide synthase n=1 Tax=Neptunomonas TaxID=75687 RepID=UPI0025B1DF60|nr:MULTISPECIES: 5-(carboxyamino)imidazole ribonucleotide synthase [Neptunomonas]MDN2660708.1 5-(carboxyamino)imidazole ribonucleotide synthase [Neptunomonas sp. CHC150]MDO6468041.1 5-(carboxyamino)imidazole ribonucleotide synthase [Neptunomonas phycophila]
MKKVWVLGAGQLGAMMKHAGLPLNVDVEAVAFDAPKVSLGSDDAVTAEIELWPQSAVTDQLSAHPNFVNKDVFPRLADRYTQKQLLDELSIATAPWRVVEAETTAASLYSALGDTVLLKRRTGGYDGRGQYWLKNAESTQVPEDFLNQSIAEQKIPFDEEVSLVGARDKDGNLFFYPLTLNLHLDGILMASVSPLSRLAQLQPVAESMLGKLLTSLNYVGVMAMECFRVGDQLMVNELAPRVHNSGHWTQAGASISQFEYHVRAVAGLTLAPARIKAQTVMINLIGVERNDGWLGVEGAELYWYGKEVRAGRKLGHINVCAPKQSDLCASLHQLSSLLPEPYPTVFEWVDRNLSSSDK